MRRIACGNHAADEWSNIRRVPFGRPDKPPDLPSLAVDQQGRGKAHRAYLARHLGRTVEIHRKLLDSYIGEKFAHCFPAAIDRQRYHLEVSSSQRGLQPVERRHLLAAWPAPGCPNVEEHDLPAKIP